MIKTTHKNLKDLTKYVSNYIETNGFGIFEKSQCMYKSKTNDDQRCAIGCTMPDEFFSYFSHNSEGTAFDMSAFWMEEGAEWIPLDYFENLVEDFSVSDRVKKELTKQLEIRLGQACPQGTLTRYLKARSIQAVMGFFQTMHDHHARMGHKESAFVNTMNHFLENVEYNPKYLEDVIIGWSWSNHPTGFLRVATASPGNDWLNSISYDNLNLKFSKHFIDDFEDHPLTWDHNSNDYTDEYYSFLNCIKANSFTGEPYMGIDDDGA